MKGVIILCDMRCFDYNAFSNIDEKNRLMASPNQLKALIGRCLLVLFANWSYLTAVCSVLIAARFERVDEGNLPLSAVAV